MRSELSEQVSSTTNQQYLTMKVIATGLLVLMAITFAVALSYEKTFWWMAWVKAFAEAAMVGALADWFAVTALFRRPLGLPFPHTAVIPSNKDRIGKELSNFIEENFLSENVIRDQAQKIAIGSKLSVWLQNEEITKKLSIRLRSFLSETFELFDDQKMRLFLQENLKTVVEKTEFSSSIGQVLSVVLNGTHRDELFQLFFTRVENFLLIQKDLISKFIRKEVPWWVPGFVHDQIFKEVFNGLRKTIQEMNRSNEHELRKRLLNNLEDFVQNLKNNPEYHRYGEQLKAEILESEFAGKYIGTLAWHVKEILLQAMKEENSNISRALHEAAFSLGQALHQSPEVQVRINLWFERIFSELLINYRSEISKVIADTMGQWDATTIVNKIESQVGKDLQYIRINGTIVGGTIGLLIHYINVTFK